MLPSLLLPAVADLRLTDVRLQDALIRPKPVDL